MLASNQKEGTWWAGSFFFTTENVKFVIRITSINILPYIGKNQSFNPFKNAINSSEHISLEIIYP